MTSFFHLAFHVQDLNTARDFYGRILGCEEGRSTENWVDFSFFGHQLSLHLGEALETRLTGKVGEHLVPMPHFGVILEVEDWMNFRDRIQDHVEFIIAPMLRFEGEAGEQWTMFFKDPFGNPLEVKGFQSLSTVYKS